MQCLFGPNKIVPPERAAEILKGCARDDRHFECHKGTIRGEPIVCAGFVAAVERGTIANQSVQVACRLGLLNPIDPETGKKPKP